MQCQGMELSLQVLSFGTRPVVGSLELSFSR